MSVAREQLWDVLAQLDGEPGAEPGTMMGHECARVAGEFLAMIDRRTDRLVVKLPRDRVDQLVADGTGLPFAPAGKVFREWVLVVGSDPDEWRGLLLEGREFVAS